MKDDRAKIIAEILAGITPAPGRQKLNEEQLKELANRTVENFDRKTCFKPVTEEHYERDPDDDNPYKLS